MSAMITT